MLKSLLAVLAVVVGLSGCSMGPKVVDTLVIQDGQTTVTLLDSPCTNPAIKSQIQQEEMNAVLMGVDPKLIDAVNKTLRAAKVESTAKDGVMHKVQACYVDPSVMGDSDHWYIWDEEGDEGPLAKTVKK